MKNGGVGTACATLARALADAGHDVTIAFVGPFEAGDQETWREHYAALGVTFVVPDGPAFPLEGAIHARASYRAYEWLKRQPAFDVVHFPEINGVGFYSLSAKRMGLAFADTCLAVTLHSPTLWHRLENREHVVHTEDLVLDFMERECVAHADVLISPTRYLLEWIADWGFQLPRDVHVHQNVTHTRSRPTSTPPSTIRELVFFGRLETRKGLEIFCDAVDLLVRKGHLSARTVTFLGKAGRVEAEDALTFLQRRTATWPVPIRIETAFDQSAALDYLLDRQALAVMPSLADNLPYTVLECLTEGIPFVSTAVGGIPELIHADDQEHVLASPDPEALSELIARRLNEHRPPVRPAIEAAQVRERWIRWHDQLTTRVSRRTEDHGHPLVSVCIATRNRPSSLRTALASLLKQTYSPFEVIVVDDASDSPEAQGLLDTLESEFSTKGWQIVRARGREGPGAARNLAAAYARGEYLLFMDDDNVARPEELATFVRCALNSGISLLTCVVDHFEGSPGQGGALTPTRRWLPLGAALVPGLFSNQFGDTNFFIERETFFELGGFDEDREARFVEDWVFLSRAALLGVKMAVVPEPLFWYRIWPEAHGQNRAASRSLHRRLLPYVHSQPPGMRAITLLAAGAHERLASRDSLASIEAARANNLSKRFERGSVWLRVGPGDQNQIRAERDLEISATGDGLLLRALGRDPIAWLVRGAPNNVHSIGRIEMTAPHDSCLQFFWSTRATPFPTEEQSVMVPVPAGRHVVWAEIPAAAHVGCLRFDPSFSAGEYVLHSLELRAEGKPAPRFARPGATWPAIRFARERLRLVLASYLTKSR